ncbi:MAG: lipopolysaccharide biosynthesis protein, partial [Pirellulales bacterium]|nr:lipopolysaccharide biosynthesis protein [Pirellulales bacterium]
SFLKHAAVYGFGTLLLQASGVVLLPLYTRYLTPADFGILEILERTGSVLTILLMANGVSGAAFSFFCQARDDQDRARIVSTVSLVVWLGILIGMVAIIAGAQPLSQLLGIDDTRLTILGLAASIVQLLPMLPMAFMQARVQSVGYIVASLITMFFRVGLVVLAVTWGGLGVWGVLWGTLIASLFSGLVLTAWEFHRWGFHPDPSKLLPVVRFAWPFMPGGLCGFVLFSGDRFFLLQHGGPDEVGVYALGARLAGIVSTVAFVPLFKVWSAWLYGVYRRPDGSRAVGRMITRLLAPYVFVGVGVCLFQHEILLIFGTAAYSGAASVIGPLIAARFFISAQVLMDGAFYVYRRTGLKLGITLFASVVVIVLYSLLIPRYQAVGAALAALGAFFVYAAATHLVSQRVFRIKYEYGRVAAMLVSGVAVVLLAEQLDLGMMNIPAKLALWAAWPLLLWSAGLVSKDEKAIVTNGLLRVFRRLRSPLAARNDESDVPAVNPAEVQ